MAGSSAPVRLFAPVSLTRFQVSKHLRVSHERFCCNDASLSSTGSTRAVFPGVISTIKALRLPAPNTKSLMDSLLRSSPCLLVRSRAAETSARAWPIYRLLPLASWTGRAQDLPGSWGIHPMPLPRSQIPAGPTDLTVTVSTVLPRYNKGEDISKNGFSRLNHAASAPAVCASRSTLPSPMQDLLPVGG